MSLTSNHGPSANCSGRGDPSARPASSQRKTPPEGPHRGLGARLLRGLPPPRGSRAGASPSRARLPGWTLQPHDQGSWVRAQGPAEGRGASRPVCSVCPHALSEGPPRAGRCPCPRGGVEHPGHRPLPSWSPRRTDWGPGPGALRPGSSCRGRGSSGPTPDPEANPAGRAESFPGAIALIHHQGTLMGTWASPVSP